MNNKQLGTEFEKEFCEMLNKEGFWVHFCTPNAAGAQPCDIVAVRRQQAYLIDCKTSTKNTFPITRLEINQQMAFIKWGLCGNKNRYVAVKYANTVYMLPYTDLWRDEKLTLNPEYLFEKWVEKQ